MTSKPDPASRLGDALALYIHWPYCARICPYCDFNVYRPKGEEEALLAAIKADMAHWAGRTPGRALSSLHFGGGTPSLLSGSQLADLIETADRLWGFQAGAEIGLEANPNDMQRFADFRSAGANRLSLGVQSFDDQSLGALGRDHDSRAVHRAISAAQSAFERLSLDLIYAQSGQGPEHWRDQLKTALSFGTGHLSAYQLTIEPGTAFAKREERGERLAADNDHGAELYELTQDLCAWAGLSAYEISNHARSQADQSRHNRIYWEGGDWIGVGPGAHGRIGRASQGGRIATAAERRPADYRRRVEQTGSGAAEIEMLSAEDEAVERILMGLRLADGLDRAHLRAATGRDVDQTALASLIEDGWISCPRPEHPDRLRLADHARVFADRLAGELAS